MQPAGAQQRVRAIRAARTFLACQAIAGSTWWVAVFLSDDVRRWTLGGLSARALVVPDLVLFVGGSAGAALLGSRRLAAVAAAWTVVVTAGLIAYATVERRAGWGAASMVLASVGSLAAVLTIWHGSLPSRWIIVGPFAFRSAPERSRPQHLFHSVAQLVVFWTTFLIVLPIIFRWVEYRWRIEWRDLVDNPPSVAGIIVFVVGSTLGVWACVAMALIGEGTPLPSAMANTLVIVGPYRFVRNPMAVAGALQTVGAGLVLGAWTVLVSAVAGGVLWNRLIRPHEEADLTERFGQPYVDYRASVRCWIPTVVRDNRDE